MTITKVYDVIVIGAGHAGCEAALAVARMGFATCLFTINLDTIGQMSCNPAVGGLAKGHLVREIDALGGEMAKVTDKAGIQFRMLNMSKGPAVWSLRAQTDRVLYRLTMRKVIEAQENLDIKQALVEKIMVRGRKGKRCSDFSRNILRSKGCHRYNRHLFERINTHWSGKFFRWQGGRVSFSRAV